MKFNFENLKEDTRSLMKEEIERAHQNNEIYFSTRFNDIGMSNWIAWLLEAVRAHDEHWLAYTIENEGGMKGFESRMKSLGGYTLARTPHTAAQTLSDGQFNRFYIAAICRLAIDSGKNEVVVYRACQRGEPRSESRSQEGTPMNAHELLEQVRSKAKSFKCALLQPNSGLSVRLG